MPQVKESVKEDKATHATVEAIKVKDGAKQLLEVGKQWEVGIDNAKVLKEQGRVKIVKEYTK